RLPEHVVVEKHLLVVLEADELRGLERRPGMHRQPRVPAQRQDAVEEEDRERRQQEAHDECGLPCPLALEPGHGWERATPWRSCCVMDKDAPRSGALPAKILTP